MSTHLVATEVCHAGSLPLASLPSAPVGLVPVSPPKVWYGRWGRGLVFGRADAAVAVVAPAHAVAAAPAAGVGLELSAALAPAAGDALAVDEIAVAVAPAAPARLS